MSDPSLEAMRMKVVLAIAALHNTLLSNPFPEIEALRYDWRAVGESLQELGAFMEMIEKQPAPEPITESIEAEKES